MATQKPSLPPKHARNAAALAKQVRRFYETKTPFRVYHGSTNSTRTLSFDRRAMLDTSELRKILRIDSKTRTAIVQSNVPMDALVRAALHYGLMPPVVPEFPGITVGGAIQGGAGESSSFKWGNVNDTINWQEMILADGNMVYASPEAHEDLFWGSAGSYGSLGVITAAEIRLIPARRYVSVTYTSVASFTEAAQVVQDATQHANDFVDGILFSPTSGVVITGTLTDKPDAPVRHFRRPHDEWFYLHAQKCAARTQTTTECIPVRDYLFRYDRGAFWMGKYAFDMFGTPFTRLNRTLLNGLLNTRRMYQALQGSGASQRFIIQDVALPANKAVPFLEFADQQFGIYPLWLCPLAVDRHAPLNANHLQTDGIINVGVWGPFTGSHAAFVAANTLLEEKVRQLGGRKWLYAHTYYPEETFWDVYDKTWYDRLRAEYHAETLPSVYDKVHVRHAPTSVRIKRGLWKAMTGRGAISIK